MKCSSALFSWCSPNFEAWPLSILQVTLKAFSFLVVFLFWLFLFFNVIHDYNISMIYTYTSILSNNSVVHSISYKFITSSITIHRYKSYGVYLLLLIGTCDHLGLDWILGDPSLEKTGYPSLGNYWYECSSFIYEWDIIKFLLSTLARWLLVSLCMTCF